MNPLDLTNREEQVIRAIYKIGGRDGLASVSEIHKLYGRAGKRFTDQALISLANKGYVYFHRHVFPGSLTREQRKFMLKYQHGGKTEYVVGVQLAPGKASEVQRVVKNPSKKKSVKRKRPPSVRVASAKRRGKRNPQYSLTATPDSRVRSMSHEFKVPTKTLANLAMRGYVQEQGGGNPNAYTYKLTKLGLARWRVEAKPKIAAKKATVKAFTAGSATRKFKRTLAGPKNMYEVSVERNPKRRRRNPGIYDDAMASIKKHMGSRTGTSLYIAEVAQDLQKKGYSWQDIKKEIIEIMRASEIVLMRLDDPLELTPTIEKYAIESGGQPNHIIYVTGNRRSVGAPRSSGLSTPTKRRGIPTGWTQASGDFQGKGSSKSVSSSDLLEAIGKLSGGRNMVAVSIADLAKELGQPQADIRYMAEQLASEGRVIVGQGGKQVIRMNPTRKRKNSPADFALAGRISRQIAALEKKRETTTTKAQIKKLQAYLAKVYERAYAAERARDAAVLSAPRSFSTKKRVGGGVRKKKANPSQRVSAKEKRIKVLEKRLHGFIQRYNKEYVFPAREAALRGYIERVQSDLAKEKAKPNPRRKNSVKSTIKKVVKSVKKVFKKRNDGSADREEFAGKTTGFKELYFPPGTPQGLSTLGPLVHIETDKANIKPAKGMAVLCQDSNHNLYVGSLTPDAAAYTGSESLRNKNLGKVQRIEYRCSKPHLGEQYRGNITWYHDFEAPLPTLKTDADGRFIFEGGGYTIRREGVVG